MVKKLQKLSADNKKNTAQLSSTVKDSAQQIWLAGLGAFSKAQAEGGKVFEALVKEGMTIQRKTQAAAEVKISETTERVTHMATDIGSKAQGQWDKLENIFEDRVAKAMAKLGVPSARDLAALTTRVDALEKAGKPASGARVAKVAPPAANADKQVAKAASRSTQAKGATKKIAAPKASVKTAPVKKVTVAPKKRAASAVAAAPDAGADKATSAG